MNYNSLSDVDKIYSYSNDIKINLHQLEHYDFRHFCLSLKIFESLVGEDAKDDYWKNFLRPLKRYRFKLCAAPIPFNYPQECQPETIELLTSYLAKCEYIYPNLMSAATDIFSSFVSLSKSDNNPILNFINKNFVRVSVLVKESYLITAINDIVDNVNKQSALEVIIPSQLRGIQHYNALIVVGAKSWFPDYIFTAPRVREINVIQYDWIKDNWNFESVFIDDSINNLKECSRIKVFFHQKKAHLKNTDITVTDYIYPDEILPPPINLNQVAKNFSRHSKIASDDVDTTKACLFLLEGQVGVFLDTSSKVIVIDLEDNEESQVKKILVTDIQQDMFLVLRTSDGGDYIIPVANRILGQQAPHLRELQQYWKSLLKNQVRYSSLHSVGRNLVKLGSETAKNEQNIRNWMSDRTIRPKDDKDFDVILRFVGLGDKLREFHEAANKIDRAHRKAGKHIRQLLLQQVRNYDLQQLEQHSIINFELAEADGVSITAFRVLDTSTETILIPSSKIAQPFTIDAEVING